VQEISEFVINVANRRENKILSLAK
jgi:hypothetical protein